MTPKPKQPESDQKGGEKIIGNGSKWCERHQKLGIECGCYGAPQPPQDLAPEPMFGLEPLIPTQHPAQDLAKGEWRVGHSEYSTIENRYLSEIEIPNSNNEVWCFADSQQEAEATAKQICEAVNHCEGLESADFDTYPPARKMIDEWMALKITFEDALQSVDKFERESISLRAELAKTHEEIARLRAKV